MFCVPVLAHEEVLSALLFSHVWWLHTLTSMHNVLGLYPSDAFFGPIFEKCSPNRGFQDFHLHKGFLFKANKLCILVKV